MIDAISKLVESGAISEDTQKAIADAWESKIKENKETVGAELREEFAKRYEHDKANMIEAIDKMMTEKLSEEIPKETVFSTLLDTATKFFSIELLGACFKNQSRILLALVIVSCVLKFR